MKIVNRRYNEEEKVLLMLAPFWAPLIPPLGSSCIKSHLDKNGYSNVKIVDANLNSQLWEMNYKYLRSLKKIIPKKDRGNFNMVAYDVLMNHLMAHINYENEMTYIKLVKSLISKNFFVEIEDEKTKQLNSIVEKFFILYKQYILELMEREKPVVVGMTVYSVTLAPSVFTFKIIKENYPNVLTVMGGGVFADQLDNSSPNFEYFLKKTPFIDKLIVGEGEALFLKMLRNELNADKRVYTLADINYEVLDINSVAIPDYSDLDVEKYTQLAAYTSRSCPYQCSFCSETVQWGKYRKKEGSKVAKELVTLRDKYNRSLFLLGDSLVNPIVTQLSNEMVALNEEIYWDAYLRADKPVCNPKNTELWRKGGFYRARLGIESGSQHVLDLMDKGITPEQIKQALKSLADAGIKTTTYWVIGHPGETEEDFNETLAVLDECKDYIYEADWHPFYFFPTGQISSNNWKNSYEIKTLYPEYAKDMLLTQTWILDAKPEREEIYDRLRRFEEHCNNLGIPNPYSLKEIYLADQRWKELHANAVPALVDLS